MKQGLKIIRRTAAKLLGTKSLHHTLKLNVSSIDRKGQAGIEFMAIILVIFFFLFLFLSLAILLVISDYVEYATFMAARTYKTGASKEEKQLEHARLVFDKYTEKIQGIARNFTLEPAMASSNNVQTSGLIATYDIDMFYMPPLFIFKTPRPSAIKLTAEAYLGRDPAFEDCSNFFESFGNKVLGISNEILIEQLEDNGC